MNQTEKQLARKDIAINYAITNFFSSYAFSEISIDEMLEDIDIKSAINSIKLVAQSLNPVIVDKVTKKEVNLNISFNKIDVISKIVDSYFSGFEVQEIMYNDNFEISEIKQKERGYFQRKYNKELAKNELYFNLQVMPDWKFLQSIFS